jgi:hypothetical protein
MNIKYGQNIPLCTIDVNLGHTGTVVGEGQQCWGSHWQLGLSLGNAELRTSSELGYNIPNHAAIRHNHKTIKTKTNPVQTRTCEADHKSSIHHTILSITERHHLSTPNHVRHI